MPDPTRSAVVAEARTWVGTPFRHQAMVKGVGVDCAQLVRAVGVTTGALAVDPDQWRRFEGYSRQPNPRLMRQALDAFLQPIPEPGPGDIGWFEWRDGQPMHLAIVAERLGRLMLIHSLDDRVHRADPSTGVRTGQVVEHGFTKEWQARLCAEAPWWRYPGLLTVDPGE